MNSRRSNLRSVGHLLWEHREHEVDQYIWSECSSKRSQPERPQIMRLALNKIQQSNVLWYPIRQRVEDEP
jgi:hypothetical protein